MSEYMVIIVGDADRWWTSMTMKERKDAYAEYARFGRELEGRGHKIKGGAELHQPAEQVGGFYLVESDDLDDLLECCTIITAVGDGIEVRRTVDPAERPA